MDSHQVSEQVNERVFLARAHLHEREISEHSQRRTVDASCAMDVPIYRNASNRTKSTRLDGIIYVNVVTT